MTAPNGLALQILPALSDPPELQRPQANVRTASRFSRHGIPRQMVQPQISGSDEERSILQPIYIPTQMTSSGCRQLCEVLGRSVCHKCVESDCKRNQLSRVPHLRSLPTNLEFVSSDLAMILQLQKWYPRLTQAQIQQKINCGQILPTAIPIELKRRRDGLSQLRASQSVSKVEQQINNNHKFFSDMEDLRRKLQDGTLTRSSGMGPKPTLMERLFPPFLSPRLLEDSTKKDKDKSAYYEPPLLPIDCQNPASNFFAGQKSKFKAQTPLPLNSDYQKAIDSRRTSGNLSRCTSRVNSHGSRHNSTAALARQPSRTSRENTLMRHMLQRQSNSRTKLW